MKGRHKFKIQRQRPPSSSNLVSCILYLFFLWKIVLPFLFPSFLSRVCKVTFHSMGIRAMKKVS